MFFATGDLAYSLPFVAILIMSRVNSGRKGYAGVNVLFFEDGMVMSSTGDALAEAEWHEHKEEIVDVARAFLRQVSTPESKFIAVKRPTLN